MSTRRANGDKWIVGKFNRAGAFVSRIRSLPGVRALERFERLCDTGSPGIYELRHGDIMLATAKVEKDEYQIDWHKPRIFYAMGAAGAAGLDDVAAWLEAR